MLKLMNWSVLFLFATATSAASAKDRVYRPPRLNNGHINLQGTWANTNLTPLERPPEFKTSVMSAEQAARMEAQFEARIHNAAAPSDPEGFEEPRMIERVSGELRSSLIIDPPDGQIPRTAFFKEKATALFKLFPMTADGPEQRLGSERCLSVPTAVAPMISLPSADLHQIVQTGSTIVIASEFNHDARIIRLNSQHTPSTITSWLGDSIGWWEGATLVVETKNFSTASELRLSPSVMFFVSPQTTVTERFTLVSSTELNYVFTVEDPLYYARAWTGEDHLLRSNEPIFEYACHEGNYSLMNILQGARAVDERLNKKGERE